MSPQYIIRFDGTDHHFMSNFYPFTPRAGLMDRYDALEIHYEGLVYPSSEHAFQAAKTLDEEEREKFQNVPSALISKRMGRKVELREDWEEVKDQVMLDVLRSKFSDPELRDRLLGTEDAVLVEGNWWHDVEWGVCHCDRCMGRGKNMLGTLLMKVRSEIQNAQ